MYIKLAKLDFSSQNSEENLNVKLSRQKSDEDQASSDLGTAALLGGAGMLLHDPTNAMAESFSSVNNKSIRDGIGTAAKKGFRGAGRMARGTIGLAGKGLALAGGYYALKGLSRGVRSLFSKDDDD